MDAGPDDDREFRVMKLPCRRESNQLSIATLPRQKTSAPISLSHFIDTSVSEVALMWILHQSALSTTGYGDPLDRQIIHFSQTVFDAIESFGVLDVKPEHLWMIYFKGLLVAETHSREAMVAAIHTVMMRNAVERAAHINNPAMAKSLCLPAKPYAAADHADWSALNQITVALGKRPQDELGGA